MQPSDESASVNAQEITWGSSAPSVPDNKPVIDPDNPPWGIISAVLVWLGSFILLGVIPAIFLLFYAVRKGLAPTSPDFQHAIAELTLSDTTAIFYLVLGNLPAHLLTVVLVWAVVTGLGKRPFWKTIGWGWGRYFGLWASIASGAILFLAGTIVAKVLGGDKQTQLEQILNSSIAARYAIAFLATFTAPFVEEFVYRGILYSAFQRLIGRVGGVIFVVALFTAVHVPQYRPNYGVIAAVGLLSLWLTIIRAVSRRLLPCFVIHLVFNGIQSLIIVLGPHFTPPTVAPNQAAIILWCVHLLRFLV